MQFAYQARDGRGQVSSGVVAAATIAEAHRMLRAEDKYVVRLDAASGQPGAESAVRSVAGRIRRDDVIYFAHQMAIMVETGVPLSEALHSVAQQTSNNRFRQVLADVNAAVQSGAPLSTAFSRHAKVFPHILIALIHASEASGTMGPMLDRASAYMTRERHTIRKIRGAMLYPLFMVLMAMGVTIFLLTFVMPRFAAIYQSRGAALPGPTRLLLTVSTAVVEHWQLWLTSLVTLVIAWLMVRGARATRLMSDHLKLRLPLIGPVFSQLYLTRAMRTMGVMINAGVPMLDVIAITRQVTNNIHYARLWDAVDESLRRGSQLSQPLFDSRLIPPSVARMISSGERAGRLGQVMHRLAEFTEADFDESIKRLTQLVEPAMICVMGLLIGFVAIGLLLPIFSISRVVAG